MDPGPPDQPPQNGGPNNMTLMYGQPPPGNEQQQGEQQGQPNPTDPSQQQQQPSYVAYPPPGTAMAFPPQMQFFAAAQPYPPQQQPGMEQPQQAQYGTFVPQPYPPQGGDAQQADYMNANQYLLARLQQQPAAWGMSPYGMPMTTTPEGFTMPVPPDGATMMMGPWSATSAGLLGKMGGPEPKKKSVRKRHKDKPKRPLSAYNLFFKDERKNILASVGKEKDEKESGEGDAPKKTTGKIGFENLAKIIGQRWQKLEPDRIEHYKKLAAVDMKRYKAAMEVFLAKIEKEKKEKYEMEGGGQQQEAVKEEEEEQDEDESDEKVAAKKEETETTQV